MVRRKEVLKTILIFSITSALALAQVTISLTGPATAKPGSSVMLSLSCNATSTGAAAFQFSVQPPVGFTQAATIGAAATAGSKSLTCTTDSTFCMIYGINLTLIGNGALASYNVTIPANAPIGPATFTLGGSAVTATGSSEVVTLGTPYSLTILDPRDINGDGKVDVSDLQVLITEIIAARSNPAACVNDLNADGKCDVFDVMVMVLKILGGP